MKKNDEEDAKTYGVVSRTEQGMGPGSGGQSGDLQGLDEIASGGSESVQELLEEGQYSEAEAVLGIEEAPNADVSEVRTRQFRVDDVPEEYENQD